MKNLKLSKHTPSKKRTIIEVAGLKIGAELVVIAGPCAIESEDQLIKTALAVKKAGASMLRGGAFKPRTSPYAFQGLGLKAIKMLDKAGQESGLPIVTEVVDTRDVAWIAEYADVLQIGARNMQNFALLREVGKTGRPILLKRNMYATAEEWLNSAEYILSEGNPNVILCERGVRGLEMYTRNTLDLSIIPVAKALSHLPVFADPSHGTGLSRLVEPMSLAALAAGADGLEIEVHISPEEALSDKEQQLSVQAFADLMQKLKQMRAFLDELGD